jgi:GT2 family glycosyltransferase
LKNTAVVILNYNGIGFLQQFLKNVIENTPEADVIVIDNFSTDQSLNWLEENFPSTLVVKNAKNHGFAGGYNHGLSGLEYENFVLLNSDVEVTPNWLVPILQRANQNSNLAAIQPKLLDFNERQKFEYAGAAGGFLDKYGYAFCRGRVFDSIENDEGQYQPPLDIFWASGACFFVKAKVFNELGGFDERFFAHMEEIDLCWRIHNAGYQIQYEPNSVVYHVGGGTLHKSNPFKTYLNYRNNLAMLFKNLPARLLFPVIFTRLVLDGLSSVKFLKEGNLRDILAILKAHLAFYAMIPYLWKKRKGPFLGVDKLHDFSVVWRYFAKKQKTYTELCSK